MLHFRAVVIADFYSIIVDAVPSALQVTLIGSGSGSLIVKRFVSVFKAGGVAGVLSAAARRIRTPHARSFAKCRELVRDRTGIEIGGPSSIFAWGGLIPVYPHARRIDNVNFASKTIWEDTTREGDSFHFYSRKEPGQQFVAEGADLRVIPERQVRFRPVLAHAGAYAQIRCGPWPSGGEC